jgi:hypothetical protein
MRSTDEAKALAAAGGGVREQLLELPLDALLLERGGLAHVVGHVREDLGDANLEPVVAARLAHDHRPGLLLEDRGGGHPVGGLVAARIGVHHHRAVRLDHHEP